MKENISFDFYYGSQAEQFSFYRIPKLLVTDKCFKKLSSDAKILYGVMLNQMSLSMKNNWVDKENRVYIIFTIEKVKELMSCSQRKAIYLLNELDTNKGIGLIEKKRQGLGKPNIIYVKNFISQGCSEVSMKTQDSEVGIKKHEVQTNAHIKTNHEKSYCEPIQKQDTTNIQPLNDKNVQKQNCTIMQFLNRKNMQLKKCKNVHTNNTNYNNTNINNINPINLSIDKMDEVELYESTIKNNIDYDFLVETSNADDCEYIDEIINLMIEIVCVKRDTVRISGAEYPYNLVKSCFMKINESHIKYILQCLQKNISKIRNIKSYMLTTIYNSYSTINSYYRAEVNHDLYGFS